MRQNFPGRYFLKASLWPALLLASLGANANMAEQGHRASVAGIDVVTYPTSVKDVVVILGALPAGDAMGTPGNIAVPTLAGMMLDRGTQSLDKFAIADKLDNVGAEIAFAVGAQSLEIRAKCLKKDLPLVMELIAADLRKPALQPQEFAKAKEQFIGSLQASLQNTEGRAHEAFDRAVFPEGHPNHPHAIAEYMTAARSATLDEVKAFIAKYYGPAHMTLVMAGDGAREIPVPLSGKPSVTVLLGQATGLKYRDPDALALRVGTAVFGHGFTGRLMGTVRDKEGLTYNIGAGMADDSITDGDWAISASFAPALLDKGIASTRRELVKWWADGITDVELADRKQGLVGGYFVGMSTTGGVASSILTSLQRGYDLGWLDAYPEAVKALTRGQVNSAIKSHLNPETMVLVKAGSVGAAAAPTSPPPPR